MHLLVLNESSFLDGQLNSLTSDDLGRHSDDTWGGSPARLYIIVCEWRDDRLFRFMHAFIFM